MRSLAVLALSALLAGCTVPLSTPAPAEAPHLLLNDVDGRRVDLDAWFGKPILLELFGVHCGSCRAEMSELSTYFERFGANGTVLMLSVDLGSRFDGLGADNETQVREFRDEFQAHWTYALDDETHQTANKYPHLGRPTLYLIAPDATIAWAHGGYAELGLLAEKTVPLLPE